MTSVLTPRLKIQKKEGRPGTSVAKPLVVAFVT